MTGSVATATVLFTDVVASTTMRTSRGDLPAHGALTEHESVIRQEIATHGGREVKTIGDGFMVVFRSARQAVDCAVAIQRSLHSRQPARGLRAVAVRIGIHTGDVIEVGDDVFGAAVDAATRIMARAKGGEILISELVRGVIGSAADFALTERRPVRLGFPTRWRLYEVDWRAPASTIARRNLAMVVTDMTGSTAATDRLGDDAGFGLLRAHNALIRAQAEANGCVSWKALGDGFLLAFERADDAIACAAGIQRALADGRRDGSEELLHVRIAVHQGTVIEEAGELFGLAVMLTFRLSEHARPDEVLVTERALGEVAAWPVHSPRSFGLRGLSGQEVAYTLDWAGRASVDGGQPTVGDGQPQSST